MCDEACREASRASERSQWSFGAVSMALEQGKRNDIYISMDRLKLSFLLIMRQVTYEILERRASNPSLVFEFRSHIKRIASQAPARENICSKFRSALLAFSPISATLMTKRGLFVASAIVSAVSCSGRR